MSSKFHLRVVAVAMLLRHMSLSGVGTFLIRDAMLVERAAFRRGQEKSVYTDPGSGLFFVQIIVAVVVAAAYRFRRLLTARFKSRRD
jgi:hypothetical protein